MPLRRALVRPPSDAYARCLRQDASRRIDAAKARSQHAAYGAALRACDAELIELPPDPDLPDACFVEDTAVIVDGQAVVTRPGAESRRGETESVESALAKFVPCRRIGRGTLDGGDVLVAGRIAFVGLSRRTDRAGAAALRSALEPLGIRTHPVPLGRFLHLKSAATWIGGETLLQIRGAFPAGTFAGFDVLETDEAHGGNVLAIGSHAIVSATAPRTADMLRSRGLDVHAVEVDEFHAGDAGVTCLSLLF